MTFYGFGVQELKHSPDFNQRVLDKKGISSPIIIMTIVLVLILFIGVWYFQNQLQKYTGWFTQSPQEYTGPVEKITLAATPFEVSTLIWIAENKNYFTDNGLEVTITLPIGGPETFNSLKSGKADVAVVGEYGFINNNPNKDIKMFGAIDAGNTNELVARKDSGILQPSDLKGKTIGVIRNIEPEFYLGTFLTLNNLKYSDVKIFDLTSEDIVEAIINGKVDAVMTYEPNVNEIKEKLGNNAISWPGQSGLPYYALLVSRQEFIASHATAIEKLLRSLVQAEEFLKSNQIESQKIVEQRIKYEHLYLFLVWPKHKFSVFLNQEMLLLMEHETRWTISNNITNATKVPNYLNYIYFDALEKVKPEAITIIR